MGTTRMPAAVALDDLAPQPTRSFEPGVPQLIDYTLAQTLREIETAETERAVAALIATLVGSRLR